MKVMVKHTDAFLVFKFQTCTSICSVVISIFMILCSPFNRKQDLESHERSGNEDSGDMSEEEEEEEVGMDKSGVMSCCSLNFS